MYWVSPLPDHPTNTLLYTHTHKKKNPPPLVVHSTHIQTTTKSKCNCITSVSKFIHFFRLIYTEQQQIYTAQNGLPWPIQVLNFGTSHSIIQFINQQEVTSRVKHEQFYSPSSPRVPIHVNVWHFSAATIHRLQISWMNMKTGICDESACACMHTCEYAHTHIRICTEWQLSNVRKLYHNENSNTPFRSANLWEVALVYG